MVVEIRVTMFVGLSDILELFFAYGATIRSKGVCDLGLDICSAKDIAVPGHKSENPLLNAVGTSFFLHGGLHPP